MNSPQTLTATDYDHDGHSEYDDTTESPETYQCANVPCKVSGLETLQQYSTQLETFLMNKAIEVRRLQGIVAMEVEEKRQQQIEHEHTIIQQARHAAMGEMLGTISHQWRQPLNIVSLLLLNMKDAWECGELTKELMDKSIVQATEQIMSLSRTIDDFRTFINPVRSTEYICPIQSVKEMVALLSGWFSNFPAIDMQMGRGVDEQLRISGCQNAFKQVILNILNNANDAIQERKRRIGLSFGGQITVHFQRNDEMVTVGVSDNGGGIAETVMEHIFEPYFSTREKGDGIVTGLYVSRLIVENTMNGRLWAENTGDGACFSIDIPMTVSGSGGGE